MHESTANHPSYAPKTYARGSVCAWLGMPLVCGAIVIVPLISDRHSCIRHDKRLYILVLVVGSEPNDHVLKKADNLLK